VKLTRASTLPQVAVGGGEHLARRGIRAVLTGQLLVQPLNGALSAPDADGEERKRPGIRPT
jgi:hypothetical protein